jgi:winged helix-turn helix protein
MHPRDSCVRLPRRSDRSWRLASARGEWAPAIAHALGCSNQTVRNAIRAFDTHGIAALTAGFSRPHTMHAAFAADAAEWLRTLLHRTPRDCRGNNPPIPGWGGWLASGVGDQDGCPPPR